MLRGLIQVLLIYIGKGLVYLGYGKRGMEAREKLGKSSRGLTIGFSLLAFLWLFLGVFGLAAFSGTEDVMISIVVLIIGLVIYIPWIMYARKQTPKLIEEAFGRETQEEKAEVPVPSAEKIVAASTAAPEQEYDGGKTVGRPAVEKPKVSVPPQVPPQPQHSAVVSVTTGAMAGRQFRCKPGTIVMAGRNPSKCNLVLSQYPAVSGTHCRIEIQDQRILVTDLQSTNGTYANGKRFPANQTVSVGSSILLQLGSGECVISIQFE